MSVSHVVVSWIQVIGLIVGLYGFFFLSISIFGNKNARWFSALLPAAGMGLGAVVMLAALPFLSPIICGLIGLFMFVGMYIGVATTSVEKELTAPRLMPKRHAALLITTTIASLGALTLIAIDVFGHESGSGATWALAYDTHLLGGGLLTLWGSELSFVVPQTLGPERLLRLGFLLSVLAILTQFIPPVLDLLSIPITKP